MPDGGARARGSVLVLGADPGEIDGLARPGDSDDLAEAPLRPFRWIVALDVQVLRQRRYVSGDGCRHDDGEGGPRRVGKGAERAASTRIDAGHSLSSGAAKYGSMIIISERGHGARFRAWTGPTNLPGCAPLPTLRFHRRSYASIVPSVTMTASPAMDAETRRPAATSAVRWMRLGRPIS